MKIQNYISNMILERPTVHTLMVVPFLETIGQWKAEKNEDSDPLFTFTVHNLKEGNRSYKPINREYAFDVAEAFFAVASAQQALEFFQTYGPMQQQEGAIRYSAVVRKRDLFLDALLNPDFGKAHDTYTIAGQQAAWRESICAKTYQWR